MVGFKYFKASKKQSFVTFGTLFCSAHLCSTLISNGYKLGRPWGNDLLQFFCSKKDTQQEFLDLSLLCLFDDFLGVLLGTTFPRSSWPDFFPVFLVLFPDWPSFSVLWVVRDHRT